MDSVFCATPAPPNKPQNHTHPPTWRPQPAGSGASTARRRRRQPKPVAPTAHLHGAKSHHFQSIAANGTASNAAGSCCPFRQSNGLAGMKTPLLGTASRASPTPHTQTPLPDPPTHPAASQQTPFSYPPTHLKTAKPGFYLTALSKIG